jgi:hypothetical protein
VRCIFDTLQHFQQAIYNIFRSHGMYAVAIGAGSRWRGLPSARPDLLASVAAISGGFTVAAPAASHHMRHHFLCDLGCSELSLLLLEMTAVISKRFPNTLRQRTLWVTCSYQGQHVSAAPPVPRAATAGQPCTLPTQSSLQRQCQTLPQPDVHHRAS